MKERKMTVEKIIQKYVEAATAYGLFLGKDAKNTNKQTDIIRKCYLELKSIESLESLVPLLSNEVESVRLWAAGHLLFVDPENAQQTLEELEMKSDLLGFDAMMTLREWKKGNLNFD